jgi:hypothetical protein
MKVLALGTNQVILSATTEEVAQLIGYYGCYSQNCPTIASGMQFEVNTAYEALRDIRALKTRLKTIQAEVQKFADVFATKKLLIDPIVEKVDKNLPAS